MEPDLMEVGASLDEARALRREHDELLVKLNVSADKVIKEQESIQVGYVPPTCEPYMLRWPPDVTAGGGGVETLYSEVQ